MAFKGLGYEAGGTAFLFTCGAKPERFGLRKRRLEQLPANSIIANRPDGSLLLIGARVLGKYLPNHSYGAFFTADGQRLLVVRTQFLQVKSVTGAVLSNFIFSEGMAEGVPMAMAMAPDGLSTSSSSDTGTSSRPLPTTERTSGGRKTIWCLENLLPGSAPRCT